MKRIHIIAATALALAVACFAASRHLSGKLADKMFETDISTTTPLCENNSQKSTPNTNCKHKMKNKAATTDPKTDATEKIQIYTSKQDIGHIGISDGKSSDNPEDNIFEVVLPKQVSNKP